MIPETGSALWTVLSETGSHLLQSTLIVVAAAGLSLLLRRYSARVRYAIWLTASVKFLLPFAAIAKLGSSLAPRLPVSPAPDTRLYFMFETFGTGLTPTDLMHTRLQASAGNPAAGDHALALWIPVCAALWAAGALAVVAMFCRRWSQWTGVKPRAAVAKSVDRSAAIWSAV